MKYLLALALVAASPVAAGGLAPPLASCDLATQRVVAGETGGAVEDERQAHVHRRIDILRADIATLRGDGRLSPAVADGLGRRLDGIGEEADGFTRTQGFLSAAERASYDRDLDAIAGEICF